MKLYLYNTLTRSKERFRPISKDKVSMYVCGPTVYDSPHIGNVRSVVVYDLLYRLLCKVYGQGHVNYVRNITDVDDKINDRAKELGVTIKELTSKTTELFHSDMNYLHCLSPNIEPRATENIAEMISIIQKLIDKSHAYVENGHVYFDVTSFADYGVLSGRKLEEMIAGSRVEVEEAKRHPGDFVLWKPADKEDDPSSIFESSFGPGRPGWHIECSAMSHRFLGENFDIHGGGADLMFPHHTNEIAQSRCAFRGSTFARYWVHNGFLTVNGEKMSKSLGNFTTVKDLSSKGINGEILRYFFLSTNYRKPLDFNDKAIYDATESLNYLYRAIEGIQTAKSDIDPEFMGHLLDDMNTSEALSSLHTKAKELHKTSDMQTKIQMASAIKAAGEFLGFFNQSPGEWFGTNIDDPKIRQLIEDRKSAKQNREWAKADSIREELLELGVALEDGPDGSVVVRRILA
ncbi:MAG: cysteine--tRNA ligase [Pseudomonadota bacterium]